MFRLLGGWTVVVVGRRTGRICLISGGVIITISTLAHDNFLFFSFKYYFMYTIISYIYVYKF